MLEATPLAHEAGANSNNTSPSVARTRTDVQISADLKNKRIISHITITPDVVSHASFPVNRAFIPDRTPEADFYLP